MGCCGSCQTNTKSLNDDEYIVIAKTDNDNNDTGIDDDDNNYKYNAKYGYIFVMGFIRQNIETMFQVSIPMDIKQLIHTMWGSFIVFQIGDKIDVVNITYDYYGTTKWDKVEIIQHKLPSESIPPQYTTFTCLSPATIKDMNLLSAEAILIAPWYKNNVIKSNNNDWKKLTVGHQIDARDKWKKWYIATILIHKLPSRSLLLYRDKLNKSQIENIDKLEQLEAIFVHYTDWEQKWDEWIFIENESIFCNCSHALCHRENSNHTMHRLAAPNTKSESQKKCKKGWRPSFKWVFISNDYSNICRCNRRCLNIKHTMTEPNKHEQTECRSNAGYTDRELTNRISTSTWQDQIS